jgi:hypothetical protein
LPLREAEISSPRRWDSSVEAVAGHGRHRRKSGLGYVTCGSSGRWKIETGSAWRHQCWNSYSSWKPLGNRFELEPKGKRIGSAQGAEGKIRPDYRALGFEQTKK